MTELQVRLRELESGREIDGLVRPTTDSDKVLWTRWHAKMPADAGDASWNWDSLIDIATVMPERYEVYSLEADGNLQGLRLIEIEGEDVPEFGVHAMRLSKAPWNRGSGGLIGVGKALVGIAIVRSIELGYDGRVHLESLHEACAFHESNGFVARGSTSIEGLPKYALSADAAAAFIERLKAEGITQ